MASKIEAKYRLQNIEIIPASRIRSLKQFIDESQNGFKQLKTKSEIPLKTTEGEAISIGFIVETKTKGKKIISSLVDFT
jgi:hypothetical protein